MGAAPGPAPDPAPDPAASPAGLTRQLGLASAVAVLVGSTLGSGIFRTPAGIATRLPGVLPMLAVWVVGALVVLAGAFALAELASAYPRTGGLYVLLREAFGRRVAFMFGFAQLTVVRAAALGAIATTFAEYALRLFGLQPADPAIAPWVHYLAAVAIVVVGALNCRGLRWGVVVQNGTTVFKFGALALVTLAAFAWWARGRSTGLEPMLAQEPLGASSYGLALVSVLWAFDGWADLSFVAGEVKQPQRNLPRALILGTLAIAAIYLAANLGYCLVLTVDEIQASPLVAAEVAERVLGPWGASFVSLTVMVSTLGTLNGTLLTAPRIFFAMAEDGQLPRRVASIHGRYGTPYVAILLCVALGASFVLLRTFEQLIDAFVTAIVPFYALAIGGVFVLRRRADYAPSYRMHGYPWLPLVFITGSVFLLGSALFDPTSRLPTLGVLGVVALGWPLHAVLWRARTPG